MSNLMKASLLWIIFLAVFIILMAVISSICRRRSLAAGSSSEGSSLLLRRLPIHLWSSLAAGTFCGILQGGFEGWRAVGYHWPLSVFYFSDLSQPPFYTIANKLLGTGISLKTFLGTSAIAGFGTVDISAVIATVIMLHWVVWTCVALPAGIAGCFLWNRMSRDSLKEAVFIWYGIIMLSATMMFRYILHINLSAIPEFFSPKGLSANAALAFVFIMALVFINKYLWPVIECRFSQHQDPIELPSLRKWLILMLMLVPAVGCLVYTYNWTPCQEPAAPRINIAAHTSFPAIPRVLLISIDSLRADHLGCYGYSRDTSPNIDRLAGQGIQLSNAISPSCWTLPSHASLFTSLPPSVHRVIGYADKLSDKNETLAELTSNAGMTTAAFVSAPYLRSSFGLNQGFSVYDDQTISFATHEESHSGVTAPIIQPEIEKWITDNAEKSFFLFVHYWDVHSNYNPPPPYDTLFDPDYDGDIDGSTFLENPDINNNMKKRDLDYLIALMDGEIRFTDDHIGRLMDLLDRLNIAEETLIILLSDHGDEFFEHGQKGHLGSVYKELIHVPLIMRIPGISHRNIVSPVSTLDVAPTILKWLGIEIPAVMQGKDLITCLRTGFPSDRIVFSEYMGRLFSAQDVGTKLISGSGIEKDKQFLFDINNDSLEQSNLLHREVMSADYFLKLAGSLTSWLNNQEQKALPQKFREKATFSDELQESLKSLGYLQ